MTQEQQISLIDNNICPDCAKKLTREDFTMPVLKRLLFKFLLALTFNPIPPDYIKSCPEHGVLYKGYLKPF